LQCEYEPSCESTILGKIKRLEISNFSELILVAKYFSNVTHLYFYNHRGEFNIQALSSFIPKLQYICDDKKSIYVNVNDNVTNDEYVYDTYTVYCNGEQSTETTISINSTLTKLNIGNTKDTDKIHISGYSDYCLILNYQIKTKALYITENYKHCYGIYINSLPNYLETLEIIINVFIHIEDSIKLCKLVILDSTNIEIKKNITIDSVHIKRAKSSISISFFECIHNIVLKELILPTKLLFNPIVNKNLKQRGYKTVKVLKGYSVVNF
jgi:hypothetical protein